MLWTSNLYKMSNSNNTCVELGLDKDAGMGGNTDGNWSRKYIAILTCHFTRTLTIVPRVFDSFYCGPLLHYCRNDTLFPPTRLLISFLLPLRSARYRRKATRESRRIVVVLKKEEKATLQAPRAEKGLYSAFYESLMNTKTLA